MGRHRTFTRFGCASALITLGACTTAPYHNQSFGSTGSNVRVEGWTLFEDRDITVQCRPYFIGTTWTPVSPSVSTTGFDITIAGETWYYFSGNVRIPNSCWFRWHSQHTAELRFVDNDGYTYEVFDQDGLDCVYDQTLGDGIAPSVAGTDCGQDVHQIYIHAPG